LRLLKEQDELKEHRLSRLRNAIDIGSEQIEQGHYTDYDVDNLQPLVEEIKAEGRKRLAQRARAERK
jgi:hypothetical protein